MCQIFWHASEKHDKLKINLNHFIKLNSTIAGEGDASGARLQRSKNADADDGAVPIRPSALAVEEPEHAHD
jgi:hypothetical protein